MRRSCLQPGPLCAGKVASGAPEGKGQVWVWVGSEHRGPSRRKGETCRCLRGSERRRKRLKDRGGVEEARGRTPQWSACSPGAPGTSAKS